MNTDHLRELISAAVDGELSPREKAELQAYLQESEEARVMFAQMKRDSQRLKRLTNLPAPKALQFNVMEAIVRQSPANSGIAPGLQRPGSTKKFNWNLIPIWSTYASAALVFLAVCVASYFFFASNDQLAEQQRNAVAKAKSNVPSDVIPGNSVKTTPKTDEPKQDIAKVDPKPVEDKPNQSGFDVGPMPRTVHDDVMTAPVGNNEEIQPIQLDRIRVSTIITPHDLPGDEVAKKKLNDELKKDELIRIDLFSQSTPKGYEMVTAALKTRGINLIQDNFLTEQLKKKSKTELVIYTDSFSPEEVAQLLIALGAESAKDNSNRHQLQAFVVAPFLPADLTILGKLLGASSTLPKVGATKTSIDITKPLPEGTATQIANSLSKMGSGTMAKNAKLALALSYSPMNPVPGNSKEIKSFLDQRADRKTGNKPLMLVIRTTN